MESILISILKTAWKELLHDYSTGDLIIRNERDLQLGLMHKCSDCINRMGEKAFVSKEDFHYGKRIDVILWSLKEKILVQLKLYHDRAEWTESPSMTNTVESDCKFACGRPDVFVGIIDVIPSTPRKKLAYNLDWREITLSDKAYELYKSTNPRTSPRERIQRVVLARGSELKI